MMVEPREEGEKNEKSGASAERRHVSLVRTVLLFPSCVQRHT